jgi:isopenicillin-N epimerase
VPPAAAREFAHHWTLEPEITYLNHGSFGACPRPVLEAQQALREPLEREPARFFHREAPALLSAAREELAQLVNAPAAGLAFVRNVTVAINSVLRSLPLAAGSELLVTDHEYNATRNVLEYAAAERGCRVVVAAVPFPTPGPEAVVEAVLARVTGRTRLAVLDHVSSQTALVFPIAELVRELQARGVDVLVDGANAPVPRELRYGVEFLWQGTDDLTPALALPAALRLVAGVLGVLGVPLPCHDEMIGAMASLPVPALPGLPAPQAASALDLDPLHDALFRDHAIEVPVLTCPAHPGRLVRISAQASTRSRTTSGLPRRCALSRAAPAAVALSKRLLWEGLGAGIGELGRREARLYAWISRQPDAREGPLAFLEKRAPVWKLSPKDLPPE